jgi:pectin methylesterase-like acyl-CoA thioesterase
MSCKASNVQGADPSAASGRFLLVGNGRFATIQAAVDGAQNSDTGILVATGHYAEQVVVGSLSDVTIRAADGASVIDAPVSLRRRHRRAAARSSASSRSELDQCRDRRNRRG